MKKFLSDVLVECNLTVSGSTTLGSASGVTVSASDNSTALATTAFVKAQGYVSTRDYISGVALNGNSLDFTGVGLAFSGSIDLSQILAASDKVVIDVRNESGGTLTKGTPVVITGTQGATDIFLVAPADAADPALMPAIGVLETDLTNNSTGTAITGGALLHFTTDPIDGATPVANQTVYVKPGGGLTLTKPTGANLIQNIGKVGKVSGGNSGSMLVSSIMRTNDVPNLSQGKIWVGSAANTIESSTVHLDEANGRLGIGINNPQAPLVLGNSAGTMQLEFNEDVSGESRILSYNRGTNAHRNLVLQGASTIFKPNGTERMRINTAGNVGIGTTAPTANLHVAAAGTGVKFSVDRDNRSNGYLDISFESQYTHYKTLTHQVFHTGGVERFRIQNNGFVAIGTDNPTQKLHVAAGDINLDLGRNIRFSNQLAISKANNGELNFFAGTSSTNGGFNFHTWNGTSYVEDALIIRNNRNVGINNSSPSRRLVVNGTTQFYDYSGADLTNQAHSNFLFDGLVTSSSSTSGGTVGAYIKLTAGATSATGYYNAFRSRAYAENMTVNTDWLVNYSAEYRNYTSTNAVNLSHHVGLHVKSLGVGGSATVTNNYGVFLEVGTAAANNYGVYQSTSGAKNYFAGSVGIGTNTPTHKLDVSGDANFSGLLEADSGILSRNKIQISQGRLWELIGNTSGFTIKDGSANQDRVVINTAGNVGIATTSPNAQLQIDTPANNQAGQGLRLNRPAAGDNYHSVEFATNGTVDWSLGQNSNDAFEVYENGAAVSTRFTIKEGGNIGIGTTAPSAKLHVSGGKVRIDSVNGLQIDASYAFGGNDGSTFSMYNRTSDDKRILRILSTSGSGWSDTVINPYGANVGVGTLTPTAKFHVAGTFKSVGINDSATAQAIFINGNGEVGIGTTSQTTALGVVGRTKTSELYVSNGNAIYTNTGNVGIGTTSPEARLHVSQGGNAELIVEGTNVSRLSLEDPSVKTTIGTYNDGSLRLGAENNAGTTGIVLKSGSVGIGKVPANGELDVNGAVYIAYSNTHTTGDISVNKSALDLYNPLEADTDEKGSIITFSDNYTDGSGFHKTTRAAIKGGTDQTGNTAAGFLAFYTDSSSANSATERMRITSAGNIGIGTTSPNSWAQLETTGTVAVGGILYIKSSQKIQGLTGFPGSAGNLSINPDGGNVGIGTSSPTVKLEVSGDLKVSDTIQLGQQLNIPSAGLSHHTNGYLYIKGGTAGLSLINDSASSGIYVVDNGTLEFYAGSSNKMHITSAGNVGIGTTSPTAKLDISAGASGADTVVMVGGTGNGNLKARHIEGKLHNSTADGILHLNYYSAEDISMVASGGNVVIGSGTTGHKLNVNGTLAVTGEVHLSERLNTGHDINFTNDSRGIDFYGENFLKKVAGRGMVMRVDAGRGPDDFLAFQHGTNGPYTYVWHSGNLTTASVAAWNAAYGWGNHAGLYAPVSHTHSAADITSGTLDGARLPWSSGNDGFTGTYGIVWRAGDNPWTASWLTVNGATDTLNTRNISATGDITLTGAINLANGVVLDHGAGDGDPAGTIIETFSSNTYIGAFLDFTIYNDDKSNMRSGTLQLVFNQGEVMFNEVNTMDIGDTSPCTLTATNNAGNVEVRFTTPDPTFHIKYHVRTL